MLTGPKSPEPPDRLQSLLHAAVTNARRAEEEVAKGDLHMAQGHALLLAQQSAEIADTITLQIAPEGASKP